MLLFVMNLGVIVEWIWEYFL